MAVLRIEHPVRDYDAWKQAFDSDPVGRQRAGVRRYRILRDVDEPDLVMIDLEFDTPDGARTLLAGLQPMWARVQGSLIEAPAARIVETVESIEY